LALFSRCPKQYEYTFDLQYRRKISAGESFGSSIHNTLKKWGGLEMKRAQQQETIQPDLFGESERKQEEKIFSKELLCTLFRESFIAEGYDTREAMTQAFERGEQALTHWFAWWKQEERTVLACEQSFRIAEGSLTLTGRFDRVEKTKNGICIIDFKTSSKRSEEELQADRQLSLYAKAATHLWKNEDIDLSLLIISEDGCREQKTKRSTEEMQQFMNESAGIQEKIVEKKFIATPSQEKCKYCPYRNVCREAM
jgi:ATP-dependent exoDNAse (exonuclease V) beta subunit